MALYSRSMEKRKSFHEFRRHEEEVVGSLCRLSNRPVSPKSQMEQEKRIRREIANSNERRRMQSINAGFQSLRALLPQHDGEKLSKAAILQQTTEYIYQLEQEKTRLLTQNCQLKRMLHQHGHDSDGGSSVDSPLPKRKKIEIPVVDTVDEGIGSMSPPGGEYGSSDELKKEMLDLRVQLDRERRLRLVLEEQSRNMEAQLYPERIREIAQQVHLEYKSHSPVHPELYTESVESEEVVEPVVVVEKNSQAREPGVAGSSVEASTVNSEPKPKPKSIEKFEPVVQQQHVNDANTQKLYVASTSRQNLETIVEAIRHLEGDHLFQDDPVPSTTCTARVIREVKREDVKQEMSTTSSSSSRRRDTTPESTFAYRQQVIQPVVRPGVIVSTHS